MKNISAEILDSFRKKYDVPGSIADITPTICQLFGVPFPAECGATPTACVIDQAQRIMDGEGKTEKALLFCVDAMGEVQRNHYTKEFAAIEKLAGFRIPSASVMPSVTPVCYGSIFSGAAPEVHGIKKYEKFVLKVETIFDVFPKGGKNVAVISVNNCSIDVIFRQRDVDYFSFRTDKQCFDFGRKLLAEKADYDLIVLYMTGYDATMHKKGIFSPEADEQARLAAERFEQLAADMDLYWKEYNRVLAFVPDHGCHNCDECHGGHGTEMPDDMVVNHYYRIMEGQK